MPLSASILRGFTPLLEFHLTDPKTGRDLLRRCARDRGLLAAVTLERPGRGGLAELVPDHVLLHEHLPKLIAVVHFERVADKFLDDPARPAPRPDRLLGPTLVEHLNLLKQLLRHKRTFFSASAHD